MKKIFLFVFASIILSQCTSIVESSLRSSLVGTWNVLEVTDVDSGDVKSAEDGDLIFFLFEDVGCDAFTLDDSGDFYTFYQSSGLATENGTWEYAFGDLNLSFDNGKELNQISFGLDGDILTLPDTIFGKAKIVTFEKEF